MTNQMKYNYNYITLFKDSNKGRSTNRMNPICAPGFVTRSLSIKGAIGNPSFFSLSDWNIHIDNAHKINVQIDFIKQDKKDFKKYVLHTWWKYSSRRHSTHASDIITGRHSFEMSQALIKIIFKDVMWSSDWKSKLSILALNASSISAWRDISVASIKIIISWNDLKIRVFKKQSD